MNSEILFRNIDRLHTTKMGIERIKKNLCLDSDVVLFCKNMILSGCNVYRNGKNWYCEVDNIRITINSSSYTIITAHIIK